MIYKLARTVLLAAAVAALGAVPGMAAGMMASSGSMMARDDTVMVGGAPMYPSRNIIQNAVNSKDHTTLVAAVKAAGLVKALEGPGPFTVFAPTNAAFDKLPAGTVKTLLEPQNKKKLTKILTAHVVKGDLSAAELTRRAEANGGSYVMRTLSGDTLTAAPIGGYLYIFDEHHHAAKVTIPDVNQSNGVIHVVNAVLLPK